jgi:proteasome lid subunit RPN8/RPN11
MAEKIVISQFNWLKILEYAQQCPTEISGFGSIIVNENDEVEVNELFPLLPQVCTGVETDPDLTSLVVSPYSKRVGLWWHSHVNMGCFWSGTDDKCIESLGETSLKYLLSIVVNKKGEYRCRFDYFKPYRMYSDELEVDVIYNFPKTQKDLITREIKMNVKKPEVKVYPVVENWKGRDYNGFDNGYRKGMIWSQKDKMWIYPPEEKVKQIPQLVGSEDTKQQDMFPVKMGQLDRTITLSEEEDYLKTGFMYDDTLKEWVFPT